MSLLTDFNMCHNGTDWTSTELEAQFKIVGDTLYFQSSHEASDWYYNFRFLPQGYDGIVLCQGFREMWKSLEPLILRAQFSRIRGYSEGAVFACLAHRLVKKNFGFAPDTIAFACPQFLWMPSLWDLADFRGITLYANANDIVTKAPPGWMGYEPPVHPVVFKNKYARPEGVGILEWYSGHSPAQYRLNLRSL